MPMTKSVEAPRLSQEDFYDHVAALRTRGDVFSKREMLDRAAWEQKRHYGISVEEFLRQKRFKAADTYTKQKARSYDEVARSITRPTMEYGGVP